MTIQEEDKLLSERLEAERRRSGHTQAQAAEIAGVSLSGYKRWEKGGPVPSDALRNLGAAGYDVLFIVTGTPSPPGSFGMRATHVPGSARQDHLQIVPLDLDKADEFTLVPVFSVTVSAGGGALNYDTEIAERLAFRTAWITSYLHRDPSALAVVHTTGDSMSPTLNEGDTLLVDRTEHKLTDGIYVLDAFERLMVKRVQMLADGGVRLKSDNPAYGAEELRDQELEQLNVVGRVVWIGRTL